jgi:hypothetical protein
MKPQTPEPGDTVRVINENSRYYAQDGVVTQACEYVLFVRLAGAVSDSQFFYSDVKEV